MAVAFPLHTDLAPHTRPVRPARPALVVIDGGRSTAARRRRATYLRRRLLVAVVALVALALGVSVVSSLTDAGAAVTATSYQVEPGDTMWTIAGSLDADADRREVVALLAAANGGSTVVRPGQHLVVPVAVNELR